MTFAYSRPAPIRSSARPKSSGRRSTKSSTARTTLSRIGSKSAGDELADIDLVDMHEAFAAQVLSVLKVLGSDSFARERLGRAPAVGTIAPARLNVHGGSLAFGHPFGATGARMVTTMANELHVTGKATALATSPAGG